jgi:hypothetical protein
MGVRQGGPSSYASTATQTNKITRSVGINNTHPRATLSPPSSGLAPWPAEIDDLLKLGEAAFLRARHRLG